MTPKHGQFPTRTGMFCSPFSNDFLRMTPLSHLLGKPFIPSFSHPFNTQFWIDNHTPDNHAPRSRPIPTASVDPLVLWLFSGLSQGEGSGKWGQSFHSPALSPLGGSEMIPATAKQPSPGSNRTLPPSGLGVITCPLHCPTQVPFILSPPLYTVSLLATLTQFDHANHFLPVYWSNQQVDNSLLQKIFWTELFAGQCAMAGDVHKEKETRSLSSQSLEPGGKHRQISETSAKCQL